MGHYTLSANFRLKGVVHQKLLALKKLVTALSCAPLLAESCLYSLGFYFVFILVIV